MRDAVISGDRLIEEAHLNSEPCVWSKIEWPLVDDCELVVTPADRPGLFGIVVDA